MASSLRLGVATAVDGGAAVEFLADAGGQLRPDARALRHGPPQPLPVQLHKARAAKVPIHQPQPGGSWQGMGEKKKASRYRPRRHFFPLLSRKSSSPPHPKLNCPVLAANTINEIRRSRKVGGGLLCCACPPVWPLPFRSPLPCPGLGRDGALTGGLRAGGRR